MDGRGVMREIDVVALAEEAVDRVLSGRYQTLDEAGRVMKSALESCREGVFAYPDSDRLMELRGLFEEMLDGNAELFEDPTHIDLDVARSALSGYLEALLAGTQTFETIPE